MSEQYDKISRNYRYFICHRYDIDLSKKRYLGYSTDTLDADNIDIGDISRYFQYIVARHFGVKHWKFYYVNKREKY